MLFIKNLSHIIKEITNNLLKKYEHRILGFI